MLFYKFDPYFHKFLDKKKLEYFCDFIHKKDKASYESSIYFFNETKELNLKVMMMLKSLFLKLML